MQARFAIKDTGRGIHADRLESIPVVFMTAKVGEAERECLLSLGASGVIAKPFDPMTLPNELDRILAA